MPGILQPRLDVPNDDDSDIHVPTLDEAIALAIAMCPEGESITLHTPECAVTAEHPEWCDCDVKVITPGARPRA
jgi:hypothetical protein